MLIKNNKLGMDNYCINTGQEEFYIDNVTIKEVKFLGKIWYYLLSFLVEKFQERRKIWETHTCVW